MVADLPLAEEETKKNEGCGWRLEVQELGHESFGSPFFLKFCGSHRVWERSTHNPGRNGTWDVASAVLRTLARRERIISSLWPGIRPCLDVLRAESGAKKRINS